MNRTALFAFASLIACAPATDDNQGDDTASHDEHDTASEEICSSSYGFCGNIEMPSPLVGTPRSMAISLYDTLEPAGPPNVTVIEIDAPAVADGQPYALEFSPLIATGEYYVWVFLYMEGGGEWAPVSNVDYVGHSDNMITFDGEAVNFPAITLALAE